MANKQVAVCIAAKALIKVYEERWKPIGSAPRDGTPILTKTDWYAPPFVVFWGNKFEEEGPMPALPPGSIIERGWLIAG